MFSHHMLVIDNMKHDWNARKASARGKKLGYADIPHQGKHRNKVCTQ